MRNYLKKDHNMPAEYNYGVAMFRAGAVFLVLLIAVAAMRLLYSPKPLEAAGTRSYTVTGTNYYSAHRHSPAAYWITLTNDETGNTHHRKVTKSQYERYPEGLKVTLPVYKIDGSIFPSIDNNHDVKKATAEYYRYKPTLVMSVSKWTLIILAIITAGLIGGGIEQVVKAGRHVFLPKEIIEGTGIGSIRQPDFDEIFNKKGKL